MSGFLHFAEHRLQEIALLVMAVVYTTRLVWLFRFRVGRDRQPRTGRLTTDPRRAALYSLANVAMPWAMESTRRHPLFYGQFVVFHVGVVANIAMSFLIPYAPGLFSSMVVVRVFQGFLAAACAVGIVRLVRRVVRPVMRKLSSPDDYFSLGLLTVWFAFGVLAAPGWPRIGEGRLLAYFLLTAFFLLYVPFSKISHYLYYPFTRYWLGRTMGHRGVFPIERRPNVTGA